MQVGKTIYGFAREMRRGRHQVFILRLMGQLVRLFYGIKRWPDNRMIYPIVNFFAHQVNLEFHITDTFFILLACF